MRCWLAAVCVCCASSGALLQAQTIRISPDSHPDVEAAIQTIARASGYQFIYADRRLEANNACSYVGKRVDDALRCVLAPSGLSYERVRPAVYAIVAHRPSAASLMPPPRTTLNVFSGRIVDPNGVPLPTAHILHIDSGTGAIADSTGAFSIALRTSRVLEAIDVRVSYLGYDQATVSLTGAESVEVVMSPQTLEVGVVDVEGSSRQSGYREGNIPLEIADLAQFRGALSQDDVLQALQWIPGIQQTGELGGGMIVRGSTDDQNLFLLEGAPIYHPWHAFNLISVFQTSAVKDLNFYRGHFPLAQGGRLSSLLDVSLRDGAGHDTPQSAVAINPLYGRGRHERALGPKTTMMIAGRRSYVDAFFRQLHPVTDDAGRRDTLRTGYYFGDLLAKVSHRPSAETALTVSAYFGRDVLNLRLPLDLSLDLDNLLRPSDLMFELDHRWENQLVSTTWRRLLGTREVRTFQLYVSRYIARESAFIQPSEASEVDSDYRVDLTDVGIRFDRSLFVRRAFVLHAGADFVRHQFDTALNATIAPTPRTSEYILQDNRRNAVEANIYTEIEADLGQGWDVSGGLRVSFFETDDRLRLLPRVDISYEAPSAPWVWHLQYAEQVQHLQRLRDRYSFLYDVVSTRWIIADRSIGPAVGRQWTTGISWHHPRHDLLGTVELYLRRAENVLQPMDTYQEKDGIIGPGIETAALLAEYAPRSTQSQGAELALQYAFGAWTLWFSYDLSQSQVGLSASGLALSDARPSFFDTPNAVRFLVQRSWGRWVASVSGMARSGYPITVPVARYVLTDPYGVETAYLYRPELNNGRLPAYSRLDARIDWTWQRQRYGGTVGIQLYNVTNHRNVLDRYFIPNARSIEVRDRLGVPIIPLFEIEVKW